MNEISHRNLLHTLHQALHWIQSAPPIFGREAHPLCLDQALPEDLSPIKPTANQLEQLTLRLNNKGNPLLGIFYESLWQFLLDESPDTRLLAHNLQVYEQNDNTKRTSGEYDLIYSHHQQIIHRELAVKFYLGLSASHHSASDSGWNKWVGPGLKDRMDIKLNRLMQHQILLSDFASGKQALEKINVNTQIKKEILIQGQLFYPVASSEQIEAFISNSSELDSPCPAPTKSNPSHLRGLWITAKQFEQWKTLFIQHQIQVPMKIQWITHLFPAFYHPYDQILQQCKRDQKPMLTVISSPNISHPTHLFIVPDHWQERAAIASNS